MFFELSMVIAVASAMAASALELHVPTSGWVIGGHEVAAWTASQSDPSTFQLVLTNGVSSYVVASDLTTGWAGATSFIVPDVTTGSGYTLEATDVDNPDAVIASSATFTVYS